MIQPITAFLFLNARCRECANGQTDLVRGAGLIHCCPHPAFPTPDYRPDFISKTLCKTISYQYFCMPRAHRMSMIKSRGLFILLMNKQQALFLTHPKKAKALSGVQ